MDYLVPAWHDQLGDWAFSIPKLEFDDTISHARFLQKGGEKIGLIITDYQPQLSTKLNQLAFNPNSLYAVYDFMQDIDIADSQVVDYRDLEWPDDAYFDFTNFRIFVISDGKLYAKIILDVQGKILAINYLMGELAGQRLLFDSRGFVSRIETQNEDIYYDPQGQWRFKHSKQNDHVVVNTELQAWCRYTEYDHLSDLVEEVLNWRILSQITQRDNLIVTVDDRSVIGFKNYDSYHPIYSISRWHPFHEFLTEINQNSQIIVDSQLIERSVIKAGMNGDNLTILPLFQSQFKLGHSQRYLQQRIGLFAENMNSDELKNILAIIYPRLLEKPQDESLHIFTYSLDKENMVNNVFADFRLKHKGEFILSRDEIDPGENKLEETELPPLLTIERKRLISNVDVLTALDKIRVLVSWDRPDQFMSMAAISVGIPQLQNYVSEEVENYRNGIVCQNYKNLDAGLSYYLNSLKNWNRALVYNVQMLNRYSEENLFSIWKNIPKDEVN